MNDGVAQMLIAIVIFLVFNLVFNILLQCNFDNSNHHLSQKSSSYQDFSLRISSVLALDGPLIKDLVCL